MPNCWLIKFKLLALLRKQTRVVESLSFLFKYSFITYWQKTLDSIHFNFVECLKDLHELEVTGQCALSDPNTVWKGKFMKEECSTSKMISPPCLCTLGAASARIAAEQWKMCFFCQMMAWHWKVLLHNCGKNDAFTAPKRTFDNHHSTTIYFCSCKC